ncbi:MAG TPA: glycosyltransferase WbuB [Candidatus Jacksonbacteria bacterium]|nr:MAG: Glycosyl transferase group 1 [Parcubacteria group bacterium GW2011_GWC2_44_22]HBH45814.1 glycosyltransferase WbuB [Candidatus Jacksonbacteria bacterium]HCC50482.1 glycosyltransferase WbuB [Candidatus Jacksonbacteria bacterium]HCE48711.1 glycosyltransferase WbuB [Candidatus Jacksonbacteria bacterium]HCR14888.1 glycosyltransferase WbuB [Candidatus Jacksonbacteria bacterium]
MTMPDKSTNLWIFNHYAVTPDLPDGTRHFDFGQELTKLWFKVTIFASSFPHSIRQEYKLTPRQTWKLENYCGVNFVWLKTRAYKKNDWRRLLNICSYYFRACKVGKKITKPPTNLAQPDVIIGSTVHPLAVLAAHRLAKHYRAKFIVEIRDLWPQSLIDMGSLSAKSLKARLLRLLERFYCSRAQSIIVLSPPARDYLIKAGYPADKIKLIPHGIAIDATPYTLPESHKTFTVVYCGSFSLVNDLAPAFEAAKIIQDQGFSDIKFKFMGAGACREELMKLTEKLKLTNVEFAEPVAKKKLPECLSQADAFLLSENKILYGASNKLLDYLAAGRPIIFSTFAAHNIISTIDCGIIADPQNHESLSEAIIKLYKLPENERLLMGQRARNFAANNFDISHLARQLAQIL